MPLESGNLKKNGDIGSEFHKKKFNELQNNLNNSKGGPAEVMQIANINPNFNLNSIIKETINKKDEAEEDGVDSDEEAFNVKNEIDLAKQDEVKEEDDDGEELSSPTISNNQEEVEKDFLYTQYEKVHRVRTKWKCNFKDAILQINGKEYIFEKITGELERDW